VDTICYPWAGIKLPQKTANSSSGGFLTWKLRLAFGPIAAHVFKRIVA
jgi:hypothetical protein